MLALASVRYVRAQILRAAQTQSLQPGQRNPRVFLQLPDRVGRPVENRGANTIVVLSGRSSRARARDLSSMLPSERG